MRLKKSLLCSLILLCLSLPVSTLAATQTCSSPCTPSKMQNLINGAAHGDTITIAAGTHDWTGAGIGVLVSKRLTISGGGTYAVNASHADTGTWPVQLNTGTATAFKFTAPPGSGNPRITGIHFSGNPTFTYCLSDFNCGLFINISPNVAFFRIDNNKFNSSGAHLGIYANSPGVIDHNFFASAATNGHGIIVHNWGASGNGDEVWAAPVGFGTASTFVFIEDNTFWRPNTIRANFENSIVDCQVGGKWVFRYNHVHNGNLVVHDKSAGGNSRGGCQAVEVYNNDFAYGSAYDADKWFTNFYMRDGTALYYNNNHVSNVQNWIQLYNAREGGAQASWGTCNGSQPWDGNVGLPGQGGYPCLDQIGRGKSLGLPPLHQPQESFPARFWNNTGAFTGGCGGTPEHGGRLCNASPATVKANRDYFFSTDASAALPGYTPYPRPHPLVGGSGDTSAPGAPKNLKVQ